MPHFKQETTDVVVIGGGPAGSAAALSLARAGFAVIQLERRVFHDPRNDPLRSGEGIVARTQHELVALGLDPKAAWALDPVDRIALHWSHSASSQSISTPASILHVDREQLDAALFRAAQQAGVDGREGWRVRDFVYTGSRVSGVAVQAPGEPTPHQIRARIVIDAGGRNALGIRRYNGRVALPGDDFFAMAMFFDDVARVADRQWEMHFFDPARLTVVQLSRITPGIVRCGLGTTQSAFRTVGLDPQAFFWQRLGASPTLRARFTHSRLVHRPFVRLALGYGVQSVAFDGLLLAGDAAGYLNPIFGDGVLRALSGGRAAAAAATRVLGSGASLRAAFAPYARRHAARTTHDRLLARLMALGYAAPSTLVALGELGRAPWALLHALMRNA